MSPKGSHFNDPLDDLLRMVNNMSDEDLQRAMDSAGASSTPTEMDRSLALEPGARVEGIVVDVQRDEVLVELDGKAHGVIQASEFEGDQVPRPGERVRATFERHDASRDLVILSVRGVRRELVWEELRVGTIVEGTVVATNKGGLTLDIRGARAFLPISQIERSRVEDLSPYLGKVLRCEVTAFERATRNVIVSRRNVLEVEAEATREKVFATLSEGQVLSGTVSRVTDHGAFIDLGGIDGLLPAAKIRARSRSPGEPDPIREGQQVEVRIVRIDPERRRISLDFEHIEADSFGKIVEHYAVGDEVTGWVSGRSQEGLLLSVEDGIVGLLPEERISLLEEMPRTGAILKTIVTGIDTNRHRLLLRPRSP